MLTYVEADREQALAIANWLREKGFGVEAVTESATTPGEGAAAGTTFVRLWTRDSPCSEGPTS